MKKNVFYVAALLAGVLSSCSQAENLSLENEEPEQFVAVLAEGETRTMLGGDDGKSVLWKEGDALAIFRKNAYNYKYTTSDNGTNSATFKYADVFTPDAEGVTGIDQYYAVYPYDDNYNIKINNNKEVTVKIPKEQTYYENTFDPKAAFMFAASTDTELQFQNAHALLKIVLKSMPGDTYTIESITLTSEKKRLSGDATIRMDDNKPFVQILNSETGVSADNDNLTLDCGEGVTIKGRTTMEDNDQEVPFYLVVTPGTYNVLDLSIKYKNIDDPVKMRIAYQDKPLTIGRNEIWTIKYTCGNDEFTGTTPEFDPTEKDVNNE